VYAPKADTVDVGHAAEVDDQAEDDQAGEDDNLDERRPELQQAREREREREESKSAATLERTASNARGRTSISPKSLMPRRLRTTMRTMKMVIHAAVGTTDVQYVTTSEPATAQRRGRIEERGQPRKAKEVRGKRGAAAVRTDVVRRDNEVLCEIAPADGDAESRVHEARGVAAEALQEEEDGQLHVRLAAVAQKDAPSSTASRSPSRRATSS